MTENTNNSFQLSLGQSEAQATTEAWLDNYDAKDENRKPILRIFGYAGTGKTTIIRHILANRPGMSCSFAAYTGKAAMVMQKQGLPARTIHSLIYKPVRPDKRKCDELMGKIKECSDPKTKRKLWKELGEAQKINFELRTRDNSALGGCDLLVLDECSMVNQEMLDDLLTFKVPIIALGDPGQLPPIDGSGAIIGEKPDVLLTEIHRQAKGNPIIDFATRARNSVMIPTGDQGTARRINKSQLTKERALNCDQILVGKNKTRRKINNYVRQLMGYNKLSAYPVEGEKLICLANDRVKNSDGFDVPIYNGMMGTVVKIHDEYDTAIELEIQFEPIDANYEKPLMVKALRAHFDAYTNEEALKAVRWWDKKDNQEFDFGYAITVHKSQGSQWDSVVIYDDGFLVWDRKDRARWLYTALTRAAEDVTLVDT